MTTIPLLDACSELHRRAFLSTLAGLLQVGTGVPEAVVICAWATGRDVRAAFKVAKRVEDGTRLSEALGIPELAVGEDEGDIPRCLLRLAYRP